MNIQFTNSIYSLTSRCWKPTSLFYWKLFEWTGRYSKNQIV